MREDEILELFAGIKSGRVSEQEALKYLKGYPYEDVGCAKISARIAKRRGRGDLRRGQNG